MPSVISKRALEFTQLSDEKAVMEPSVKKRKLSTSQISERVPEAHRWTATTFPVPQLSSRVLALFDNNEFLLKLKVFVHEVGDHFMNVVQKSYAKVYQIYVEALMLQYPQIGECARDAHKGDKDIGQGGMTDSEAGGTNKDSEKITKEFGVCYA